MSNKIQANRANSKEIQALKSRFPNANIPTEIPEHNKNAFNILGITVHKTGVGAQIKVITRVFTKTKQEWELYKGKQEHAAYFGYEEIVILHNPTIEDSLKQLSNVQKKEVNAMLSDKKSIDEISEALGLDKNRVMAFVAKKK